MKQIFALTLLAASVFFSQWTNAAASSSPRNDHEEQQTTPFMIRQLTVMRDWLGRLHSLLVQEKPNVDKATPRPRAPSKVQLARHGIDWSKSSTNSPASWAKFTPSLVTMDTPSSGVLVAFFGAHVSRPSASAAFQARYVINGSTAFDGDWGVFYIDAGSMGGWRPFCFSQMYALPRNWRSASIQLQTKSSSVSINGGALFAAVFPPPAFLSSI